MDTIIYVSLAFHEIGFDTMFMYTWRNREKVLNLLATIGGNRVNYGVNTFGGVRRDFDETINAEILSTVDLLEEEIKSYLHLALTEYTLHVSTL